jgi:hypothetical protein
MNIENVTITGPANGFVISTLANNVVYGIWFNDASGTVSNNVTVENILQQMNPQAPAPQTGRAIRADAVTGPRTVTITGTTVRNYQKSGFEARNLGAPMTMDVSGSTAGPPADLPGFIAQNAISYVGASGTIEHNTIHGSTAETTQGPAGPSPSTAVLLSGAVNVTVNENTIVGVSSDLGISVSANSSGITLSRNSVTRTPPTPANPLNPGVGIDVEWPTSSATLICNTFAGWIVNVQGAIQIGCAPLPDGAECNAYSAPTRTVEGGTGPVTWALAEGSDPLPPGLTLNTADGTITGTPTAAGTYPFTLQVTDSTEPPLAATSPQSITIAPGCQTPTPTPTVTPTPTPTPTASGGGSGQTPAAAAAPSGELAFTGASGLRPMLTAALALLVAGITLTALVARRGRAGGH